MIASERFRRRPSLPIQGWQAGRGWFGASACRAPVRRPSAVSDQHVKASFREAGEWTIFDKRYWPGESFGDQLGFALRHENLDLLVLKRIFEAVPRDTVAVFVRSAPTGAPNRRAWFLYEFLTGRTLDIDDAAEAGFTDLLDSRLYFTARAGSVPPPQGPRQSARQPGLLPNHS